MAVALVAGRRDGPSAKLDPLTADSLNAEGVGLGQGFVGEASDLRLVNSGKPQLFPDGRHQRIGVMALESDANVGMPCHGEWRLKCLANRITCKRFAVPSYLEKASKRVRVRRSCYSVDRGVYLSEAILAVISVPSRQEGWGDLCYDQNGQ